MPAKFVPRLINTGLEADLEAFPVSVLTGARQTGKSTLVLEGEFLRPRAYVTLDDLSVSDQAQNAPRDLVVRHPVMTLDEVQREPGLLLTIKQVVDEERPRRPGRFLLTGSANLLLMEQVADSLAGRASYRVLRSMTRREQLGHGRAGLWSELLARSVTAWPEILAQDNTGHEEWTSLARRGGMPVPAIELRDGSARSSWFEGYVRTYLERDLRELSVVHSLPDFRRLMRAAAHRAGALLNRTEIARDVGMPQPTVHRHMNLLLTSHLLEFIEPYSVNRTKRLIKAPKLYWGDTGLALHLSGGEPSGAHLENLVLLDLLAWADSVPGARPNILYWRTASGQEVDAVIEHEAGLIGIEVKTTGRPHNRDAQHLRAFRDEYGDDVLGCLLLHTGDEVYRLEDRIVVAPWWRVL